MSATDELNYGLQLLASDPIHEQRYTQYLSPMVYADNPVNWKDAFSTFNILVNEVLDYIGQKN